jgi:CheY-like chemotaxis protein
MEGIIRRSDGLSLLSAHNAELGLEMARSLDPDMIILDFNLPGINGLQALETLEKMQIVPRIPVIALSAAATRKDIKKGLDAGFQEYLTKPVDLHDVLGVINKLLTS